MERVLIIALKLVGWLKIPATLALAVVFFLPPNFVKTNALVLSLAQQRSQEIAAALRGNHNSRQDGEDAAEIRSLERRMDTLEELRIDASIASLKATIEYDHSLLMTIAGAVLLMMVSHVLSFLKQRRGGKAEPL